MDTTYIDPANGKTFPLDVPRWSSDQHTPLMLTECPGISRNDIDRAVRSLWRYAAALPIRPNAPVSLGEGFTPLIKSHWRGADLHFKLDHLNPTGSFKDRGATVMLSILREQGIDHVLEDSSGNGGAAIAAYAAAGGLRAKILVPAATAPAKTVQIRAYGAEIEIVPGTRQDCANEAVQQAEKIFYASHNWQPFFLQGTKTLAYELWEDFGFTRPDNVIVPCGAGSLVLGCDIGFGELLRRGEIESLPRLFAVQPANCAPIEATFRSGRDVPVPIASKPTIAEGTAIARPVRLGQVVSAIRRSRGATIAVAEAAIVAATWDLARQGLYVEPTSAMAAAAAAELIATGVIDARETNVVVMTGSGLKATQRLGELQGVLKG